MKMIITYINDTEDGEYYSSFTRTISKRGHRSAQELSKESQREMFNRGGYWRPDERFIPWHRITSIVLEEE